MSACHRLPLVKSVWFTQNTPSDIFVCDPPLSPRLFPPVWNKKYKRWLSRQLGREGGSVNHIKESVSGTIRKICAGQGGIEWEAPVCWCVCVSVKDMNGCPAMNTQLHWPDCWDSWSVDNREAVFNMRLRYNKPVKRQIRLSSCAHWGNHPSDAARLCRVFSSLRLLRSSD